MQRRDLCCYCRTSPAVSSDHVPPKTLFAKPRPSTLITVPACRGCHSGSWSKDDEYFRLVVALSEQTGANPEARRARESALRSLSRHQARGLRISFLSETSTVSLRSAAGLHLGRGLVYTVDLPRVFRVVERVVRGLHYHETGASLPAEHDVVVASDETLSSLPAEELAEYRMTIIEPLAQVPRTILADRVFWYRVARVAQGAHELSVWALTFYASITFLALTGPAEFRRAGASEVER